MLETISAELFRPLVGSTCILQFSDGGHLPVQVSSIAEKPMSRAAQDHRLPFNVSLVSLQPTPFVDGLCAMEVPELGLLQDMFVSRVPAMGRDESLAYYCISFN